MLAQVRAFGIDWVRRYHRLEISGDLETPTGPTLFVANHGFGSLFDLNVFAAMAVIDEIASERDLTILVHQIAWTVGLGPLMDQLGCVPASARAATDALAEGRHVLVFPGGDIDAFKARKDKDRIVFSGRSGFARLAHEAGVPIRPIVIAGAGDTVYVLSDGQKLAKALRLDKAFRLKALPISLAFPWGLNIGLAGFLPYVGARKQLRGRVLSPVASTSSDFAQVAATVAESMQLALDELAGL
jgi:1-acyl-sn-glycerol-3-phosphate acyltransferase